MTLSMMIDPKYYTLQFENADYHDLIKERDHLIKLLKRFEKKELAGDRSGEEWHFKEQPDVVYKFQLEYLIELCKLMNEKYENEYYCTGRTLAAGYHNNESNDESNEKSNSFLFFLHKK